MWPLNFSFIYFCEDFGYCFFEAVSLRSSWPGPCYTRLASNSLDSCLWGYRHALPSLDKLSLNLTIQYYHPLKKKKRQGFSINAQPNPETEDDI